MITAAELAKVVGAEVSAASQAMIQRVSSIEDADEHAAVFAQDERALERALQSRAGVIFARKGTLDVNDVRVLWVRDPRYAMALAARALAVEFEGPAIHPSAVVHTSARLGERVRIGAGSVVEANAVLGDDVVLHSRVTIAQGVQIGARVVVQSGAVLGSLGFGYVRDAQSGEYLLFPQQGALVIEDDVEIGANTTIDRGALGETRIGRGTKIDNLVHIAHNCRVGRDVIIAAQVGISGSCVIEDGVTIAGQVGLGDHVRIGPGVILGGQSGVYPGKEVEGPGQIFAGTPAEPRAAYLRSMARVRRLK